MTLIKNKEELLSHGNLTGRRLALDIIEYALEVMNVERRVKKIIKLRNNDSLVVGGTTYRLSDISNVYVLGAGKGSIYMGKALEEILDDRIKGGIIVEKEGQGMKLKRIKVLEASHPIPDERGYEAAKAILELAKQVTSKDLVFVCIMGGASALLPYPIENITLDELKIATDTLLKCGARIDEINSIRNHIEKLKGGRLAMELHPAKIINLIVIDEVAGLPWGPTVPDKSTFRDAFNVIKKYKLHDKIPRSIISYLEKGLRGEVPETPKEEDFRRLGIRISNVILGNAKMLCEAACRRAKKLGLNSMILSTMIEGESREVGIVLAGIAKEIVKSKRPIKPPCAVISGGELTVTITGEHGEGGRNQEFVLSFAQMIKNERRIVIASVNTDGSDGPTSIAGGIADGYTADRAEELGIDLTEELLRHNSSYVLRALRDAIYTGPTGTNIMDLRVFVII